LLSYLLALHHIKPLPVPEAEAVASQEENPFKNRKIVPGKQTLAKQLVPKGPLTPAKAPVSAQ
jgi:hypothetical protein